MMGRSTVSLPAVGPDGERPLFGRSLRVRSAVFREKIDGVIERLGQGPPSLDDEHEDLLRSLIFIHYHPEFNTRSRIQVYHTVKKSLEQGNLETLRNIAGIRERCPYINTLSNVGKRGSYFGGLIGITVAGYFFLPPLVKLGVIPILRRFIRRMKPRRTHLIPIDPSLRLSALAGGSPDQIYSGIREAMGQSVRRAGRPVGAAIDTTPMDDLVGNLFFCALIGHSNFSGEMRHDLRRRAQIAFLHDMAKVSRQLEGLTLNPALAWERIVYYTNFAMFLKSLDSSEVPIQAMLRHAVETISRARVGDKRHETRFYAEFERGLRFLNYAMQVADPLDQFNQPDVFDDIESEEARIAFFDQNHRVMERLYLGHEKPLSRVRPMFVEFCRIARDPALRRIPPGGQRYRIFQKRVKSAIASYRQPFLELGRAELKCYDDELRRLRG